MESDAEKTHRTNEPDPEVWVMGSGVVLETRVLVSRRLEDKNESLGLGLGS